MTDQQDADTTLASRGALLAAALFVALIVLFSIGSTTRSALLLIAVVAITGHLVLFPTIVVAPASAWARPAGYGWVIVDVMLNGATLNGVDNALVMPLRLGGHFLAALWIANCAASARGAVRPVGLVLAALLAGHALVARWSPDWAIYPPFLLMPAWLLLLGLQLRRRT